MNIKHLSIIAALLAATLTGCATAPTPPTQAEKSSAPKTVKSANTHPVEQAEKKPLPKNTLPPTESPPAENLTIKKPVATLPINNLTPEKKAPANMAWQVTVIQNGVALENNHEQITLKKAPFSIRVTLPAPYPVRFTAASVPSDLETSHTDKKLKALCTPVNLTPFCLDKATAYLDQNHNLSLEKLTHHYFFYRKNINLAWMQVHITPQQTTLEWTIKTINNKPVASYKDPEIYMTLWVDSENRLVFDKGELKQLILSFSK